MMLFDRESAIMKMNNNQNYDNAAIIAFDNMHHPPISNYLGKEEIYMLYKLATDPKYASVTKQSKFDVYDAILEKEHFMRFHLGTNRAVYRHQFDPRFLIKIGLDNIGISDNIREAKNQELLKPFVPKIFDVTECGTVQMCERVEPFVHKELFEKYGKEIFDAIQCILKGNKYILEDIGTNFFMNWGLRRGFGPVVLDFPYVYLRQKDRTKCIAPRKDGNGLCGGDIDYDDGYNELICKKCGQRYAAKDIGSDPEYLINREIAKRKMNSKEAFTMDENIVFTFEYADNNGNKKVIHESVNSNGISSNIAAKILSSKSVEENSINVTPHESSDDDISVSIIPTEVETKSLNKHTVEIPKEISVEVNDDNNVDIATMLTDLVLYASESRYETFKKALEVFQNNLRNYFGEMTPRAYKDIMNSSIKLGEMAYRINEDNIGNGFYNGAESDNQKTVFVDQDDISRKMDINHIKIRHPETKRIIHNLYENDYMINIPRSCSDFAKIAKVIDKIIDKEDLTIDQKADKIVKSLSPKSGGLYPSYVTHPYIDSNILENIIHNNISNDD